MIAAQLVVANGGPVLVCPPCPQCGRNTRLVISEREKENWHAMKRGELTLGMAFGHWPAFQRELLMTGLHPDCWDAYVGPEPEDEEEVQ